METAVEIRIRMAELQLAALENKFRQDSVSYQRQVRKLTKELAEKTAVSNKLKQEMQEVAEEQKECHETV